MTRRPVPTRNAVKRRKPGVHVDFGTPDLPTGLEADITATVARDRQVWPVLSARAFLLQTIADVAPEVLTALSSVAVGDHVALDHWCRQYRLTAPWMRTAAEQTLVLWASWPEGRGRVWDVNTEQPIGALGARSRGRRPGRPAPLRIRHAHFAWWVRMRVLRQSAFKVADALAETSGPDTSTDPRTIARAVQKLTKFLS